MPSPSRPCATESGRYHLAQALFDAFKYKIRCLKCKGNPTEPGFVTDNAGNADKDGRPRRYWKCQRSNSQKAKNKCGRVSCAVYIDLAREQLEPAQFAELLRSVCQRYPPEKDEHAALHGYLNAVSTQEAALPDPAPHPAFAALLKKPVAKPPPVTPKPNPACSTLPQKRKAHEELPSRSKAANHTQAQQRRESDAPDVHRLWDMSQHLEELIKMAEEMVKVWKGQGRVLRLFLTSSSLPQPTPSCTTPSWSSPSLAPPDVFSSDGIPDGGILSDATIPCTFPDEPLSSSPTKHSATGREPSSSNPSHTSPVHVYLSGMSQGGLHHPPVLESSSPTPASSTSSTHPTPSTSRSRSETCPDPASRVRELVQQFNDARGHPDATAKRRAIRDQAKEERLHKPFQQLLQQKDPLPELKCSDRT